MRYFLLKIGFIFYCALFLSACATHQLAVHAYASQKLNVDASAHSLSVQVHLYQLNDKEAFVQATFVKLWQLPQKTLGDSLLQSNHFEINPGQNQHFLINRAQAAEYIAAIAIFRDPTSQHWRAIRQMPERIPYHHSVIRLYLERNSLHWGSS